MSLDCQTFGLPKGAAIQQTKHPRMTYEMQGEPLINQYSFEEEGDPSEQVDDDDFD